MHKIIPIFPKAIYQSNIQRAFTDIELSAIESYRSNLIDNIGNTQTFDHDVLSNDSLQDIKTFIIHNLITYYQQIINPRDKLQLYITQSWLNYTKSNQYHHKHKHPNSILSGVLYINTNPKVDRVSFYHDDYERIEIIPKQYNQFNSKAWTTSVDIGDILIFPSDLSHMVETKIGENERISLAFNTFVRGELGEELGASKLIIR